ncbi:hypothetical protein ACWCPC_23325, partial [Streptomyces decoyicus]
MGVRARALPGVGGLFRCGVGVRPLGVQLGACFVALAGDTPQEDGSAGGAASFQPLSGGVYLDSDAEERGVDITKPASLNIALGVQMRRE